MRKGLLLAPAVAALLLVLLVPSAGAAPGVVVGIGDQKTQIFEDPRIPWLGIREARLVVPWYVATGRNRTELGYVDRWLAEARRASVKPVVGFGHGFSGKMRRYLPRTSEFRVAVRAFRKRYPWVRTFITWNEANHCSQPTCKKPERAAAFHDALVAACRGCVVTSPAVLDQPNMVRWLKRFRKAARRDPRIYSLHNYIDVNRKRLTGTRRLIRAVPNGSRIWIVETGGLVYRKRKIATTVAFPENEQHAGQVTSFVLRSARRLPKIDRVYLYHWNPDRFQPTWDSGLVDHLGAPRPGFDALARFLRRDPRKAPQLAAPPPPPPPTPIAQTQPPAEQQSTTQPPPQQQQPSDPPPPSEPEPEPEPGFCEAVPLLCP